MSAASKPPVPNLVRDALERDGAYDFGPTGLAFCFLIST